MLTVVSVEGRIWEERVEARSNRFMVKMQSRLICHLHDPGRLKELVYPGNRVLVRETRGIKTSCSVLAGWDGEWVIIDSRFHPVIARRFLPPDAESEVRVGHSRLDFHFNDTWVEVKGCSLVRNGIALFPDAPTRRGERHLRELIKLREEGHDAMLMILVMRPATCFLPNKDTDPSFSEAFWEALDRGVKLTIKSFKLEGRDIVYVSDIGLCNKAE
ncbi:Sugar fermentation stimulation protein [Metallosphaera sp. J1]|uniref:DNA/RNA nuclease SfsA n=1 Tax=Metallosphaera javensis (ex Hofmann et al. 2022) TaxID=99938 RepID=UPI001EDD9744|nr:DNA/RNA nuclease SfsA [Metallosphaera javensis (ex Hofmann et al. 2022)]MCG3108178.1 Sugar fermentation stimulation protein [Metallosphaera javensis (ex Hofmann et al. 2022)]